MAARLLAGDLMAAGLMIRLLAATVKNVLITNCKFFLKNTDIESPTDKGDIIRSLIRWGHN